MFNLIPSVKVLEIKEGFLKKKAISYKNPTIDSRIIRALNKLPFDKDGADISFEIGDGGEGYELFIKENKIKIAADGAAGAFYAVQTLRQLFREESVPCVYIKDYPDFKYRGFYHDNTRGKIPTVDTLKKLIDQMAYYKLNALQLYVEHTYEFEEYKELSVKFGYLSKEELREIGHYCKENFIDFAPSLSTFGHLYELLSQEKYKHLRVLKNYEDTPNHWRQRMEHHTIDPINPESIEVIKSLIDQYAPNFESEYFNICCDETFDLKAYGKEGLDEGRLYVDFTKQIIEHVKEKGKTVMMWADILLLHPETIKELPEDIVFLNWDYDANPKIENIEKLASLQKTQIVCPGTWSWRGFCENISVEEKNISTMAEEGFKNGAIGVLNTNWGDWGNPCSLEMAMYGLVLGAEKSWSANTSIDDQYRDRVNKNVYECEKGVEYLTELNELHSLLNWFRFGDRYFEYRYNFGSNFAPALKCDLDEFLDKCRALRDKVSEENWTCGDFKEEMLIAIEALMVLSELYEKMQGKTFERTTNAKDWLKKYKEKWLSKNKKSELYKIEDMISFIEEN